MEAGARCRGILHETSGKEFIQRAIAPRTAPRVTDEANRWKGALAGTVADLTSTALHTRRCGFRHTACAFPNGAHSTILTHVVAEVRKRPQLQLQQNGGLALPASSSEGSPSTSLSDGPSKLFFLFRGLDSVRYAKHSVFLHHGFLNGLNSEGISFGDGSIKLSLFSAVWT